MADTVVEQIVEGQALAEEGKALAAKKHPLEVAECRRACRAIGLTGVLFTVEDGRESMGARGWIDVLQGDANTHNWAGSVPRGQGWIAESYVIHSRLKEDHARRLTGYVLPEVYTEWVAAGKPRYCPQYPLPTEPYNTPEPLAIVKATEPTVQSDVTT